MAINEKAVVEVQVNSQQAKDHLKDLEAHAASLQKQMDAAFNAGDTRHMKQLQKELRSVNAEINTTKKSTTALTQVMHNLDKATPKELRNTLKAINRELNSGHIKRGSAEWKYYQQQAKLVSQELRNIQNETRETEGWLTRFNNGLSKWGGLAASAAAAITGIAMTLNSLRNNRNNKEDAQAELKALTGLGDDSIAWLTEQAEILSTTMEKSGLRIRQSSDEILKAYMLVGSKKPELLGNKEALNAVTIETMRLAAAAKIDLKEAVEATTISLNMFGENADQAAKYVNILAAGSQAGSAAVAAQTASIKNAGVAAATAGVTMEQLNGVIQTLAKKGIEAEPAGTALRKFFLVLQTGADETNPKVVGLDKALENLAAQQLSAGDIQKKFGEEAFSAASIIINSIDDYKHFTKAVTDTNVAIEQAAINSDTASAKLEQHKNEIKEAGIELMERLNPSLSMLTGWTSKIIAALPKLIDWFIEYKGVITASAVAIGAYTVAVNLAAIKTKIYTVATKAATVATAAFNTVTKFSPVGAAIAVVSGLAALFGGKYVASMNAAKKAQAEFNKELGKTKEQMDSFNAVKENAKNIKQMSEDEKNELRQKARDEIAILKKSMYDKENEYRDHYNERINYIMKHSAGMSSKYMQEQFEKEKKVLQKKWESLKPMQNAIKEMEDVIDKLNEEEPVKKTNTKGTVVTGNIDAATIAEQKRYEDELLDLKRTYLNNAEMTQDEYRQFSEDAERRHLENMLQIAGLEPEKRQKILNQLLDLQIKFKEKCREVAGTDTEGISEAAFNKIDKQYQLDVQQATKRHFDSLSSEEEYYNEMKALRDKYYEDITNSTEISEDKKAEIQKQKEEESIEESRRNYNKHLQQVREAVGFYKELGEQFGQVLADLITDSETSMGDFFKETTKMMLDALQRTMIMAIAKTQIDALSEKGALTFVALAKAAAKIALITAAFETAKAVISGFEQGGYTGDGAHDEVKGVVHAGEFVVNRQAVGNPNVRGVLDLINTAQRNNTVSSLTAADVSSSVGSHGNSYTTNNNYSTISDNSSNSMLVILIEKLIKKLDTPIMTYTKATGKMGVNEAQNLVERMKDNVRRII